MVPDEEYPNAAITSFDEVFKELSVKRPLKRAGIVGASQMPVSVYRQIEAAFRGVEMVDMTEEYGRLRYVKSPWEIDQIRKAHQLADVAYDAMAKQVKPRRARVRGGRGRGVPGTRSGSERIRLQSHCGEWKAIERRCSDEPATGPCRPERR